MSIYYLCAIMAIVSYLVGGINGAIIMSKLVYHEDIREKGSKNPGFTNFKRVYGLNVISWIVLLMDILKTALPVFISAYLFYRMFDMWQVGAAFAGLFCMIGHCFPVWYKFKGGKAFIAGFATTWFVDWRMALIAAVIFFAVLFTIKYMSVASCTASIACPIILLILGYDSIIAWILCFVSALLVIVRHKENFVRLSRKEESQFSIHS